MAHVGLFNIVLNYANSMETDIGGTEILKPLQELYTNIQEECIGQQTPLPRQIFVFTNGEVSNIDKTIEFLRNLQTKLCLLFWNQSTRQFSSSSRYFSMRGCRRIDL